MLCGISFLLSNMDENKISWEIFAKHINVFIILVHAEVVIGTKVDTSYIEVSFIINIKKSKNWCL